MQVLKLLVSGPSPILVPDSIKSEGLPVTEGPSRGGKNGLAVRNGWLPSVRFGRKSAVYPYNAASPLLYSPAILLPVPVNPAIHAGLILTKTAPVWSRRSPMDIR